MSLDQNIEVEPLTDESIDLQISKFEQTYGMSSEEFLRRFESGRVDDTSAFIDWSGLLQVAVRIGLHQSART